MNYKKIISNRRLRLTILNLFEFVPDKVMLKIQYRIKTGRKLNLKNPQRFSEKIQWYKLYYKNPEMVRCVDKYDVREYVKEKDLEDILIPCYGVYDTVESINWNKLPDQFVMKDTLGGGGTSVQIIRDKNKEDIIQLMNTARKWLSLDAHKKDVSREWPYNSGKPHRVIIEKLLNPGENDDIIDYKFFCFNGTPTILYVIGERNLGEGCGLSIYDCDYKKIEVSRNDEKQLKKSIIKPKCFDEMLHISSKLSSGFPHVRVDLYEINGKVYFGELTFYDGSGYMTYEPDSFDYELGHMFELPEITNNLSVCK